MSAARVVGGVALLALAGWALVAVFRPPPAPAPARSFTSSRQCQECHADAFAEWEASQHAQAWTNPEVRLLSNDFANTDCIDCHAPRPVFSTGIGKRVLPRSARRSEGVDCIACHLLPNGRVAGSITADGAPCRPIATVELTRPEFCAGCHDQHETVAQWRASPAAAAGQDCRSCHLPRRDGAPGSGRDHGMWGGHDLELVRSAVELRATRDGDGIAVAVENVFAGHHFPTDERSRAADVFWRPVVAGEAVPWRHLYRFRSPYRHEVDVEDTLLPAGETLRVVLSDADAQGPCEVALFYMRKPYWSDHERPDPDREAELVHRVEVAGR